jgi:hypothetical protein
VTGFLSEEPNPVRENRQRILVLCTFGKWPLTQKGPFAPRSLRGPYLRHCYKFIFTGRRAVPCVVLCRRVILCCVVSCRVVLCRVMSCCVVSCRVVLCHVVLCCVVSCRVVSCCVMSCHVVSCHVVLCRVVSCRVVLWSNQEHAVQGIYGVFARSLASVAAATIDFVFAFAAE